MMKCLSVCDALSSLFRAEWQSAEQDVEKSPKCTKQGRAIHPRPRRQEANYDLVSMMVMPMMIVILMMMSVMEICCDSRPRRLDRPVPSAVDSCPAIPQLLSWSM